MENLAIFNNTSNKQVLSEVVFQNNNDEYTRLYSRFEIEIDKYFSSDKEISDFNAVIENRLKFYCGEDILDKIKNISVDTIFSKFNEDGTIRYNGFLTLSKDYFCQQCTKYVLREKILPESHKTDDGHFVIYYSSSLSKKAIDDIENILVNNFDRVCEFFNLEENEKNMLITEVSICNSEELELIHLYDFGEKKQEWIGGWYGYRYCVSHSPDNASSTDEYESRLITPLHEFVHAVTLFLSYEKLRAGWISEGVAEYVSNKREPYILRKDLQKALNEYPLKKKNLKKLFSGDSDKERKSFYSLGSAGYRYSYTLIDYIINSPEFGIKEEDRIKKIEEIFRKPEISPFKILGVSKNEFRNGWFDYLYNVYLKKNSNTSE